MVEIDCLDKFEQLYSYVEDSKARPSHCIDLFSVVYVKETNQPVKYVHGHKAVDCLPLIIQHS